MARSPPRRATLASPDTPFHLLDRFNNAVKRQILSLQEYFVLAGKAIGFIFARPFYGGDVVQQMDAI
ncbi:MAG TPA: hypothetical protein VF975_11265, partial [Thermoanaerobaculia bacterium]